MIYLAPRPVATSLVLSSLLPEEKPRRRSLSHPRAFRHGKVQSCRLPKPNRPATSAHVPYKSKCRLSSNQRANRLRYASNPFQCWDSWAQTKQDKLIARRPSPKCNLLAGESESRRRTFAKPRLSRSAIRPVRSCPWTSSSRRVAHRQRDPPA